MQIEQIDRDAAADLMLDLYGDRFAGDRAARERVLRGEDDASIFVRGYARHRLASLSARPAVGEDVVERGHPLYEAALQRLSDYAKDMAAQADEIDRLRGLLSGYCECAAKAFGELDADMGGAMPAQDLWEFLDEFVKDPRIAPHLEAAREEVRKDLAAMGSADMGKGGEG